MWPGLFLSIVELRPQATKTRGSIYEVGKRRRASQKRAQSSVSRFWIDFSWTFGLKGCLLWSSYPGGSTFSCGCRMKSEAVMDDEGENEFVSEQVNEIVKVVRLLYLRLSSI